MHLAKVEVRMDSSEGGSPLYPKGLNGSEFGRGGGWESPPVVRWPPLAAPVAVNPSGLPLGLRGGRSLEGHFLCVTALGSPGIIPACGVEILVVPHILHMWQGNTMCMC